MTDNHDPAASGWHLDRRIPIALVITIVMQTGALAWWASSLSERVTQLERTSIAASDQPGKVIRLETQMESLTATVGRIEQKLDRALQPPPERTTP